MPDGTGPTPTQRGRLVLSRHEGERVRIVTPSGETIWLYIDTVDRGKVRLCIDASTRCNIAREELLPCAEWYSQTVGRGRMPTHGLGSE